jgi:hypothetical protein
VTATIRLRRAGHRGSVVATGLVVDTALVGVAEARRRVIAAWTPGATVHEADGLLVVTGLRATRLRAELAAGAPIVVDGGVATTVPLDDDERDALAAITVPGAVVIARAGAAAIVAPSAPVDVATWIDLDDAAILAAGPLAGAPARAAVPAAVDVRAALGITGGVDAELGGALRRALASGGQTAAVVGARRPSRWSRLLRWLADRVPTTTVTGTGTGATTAAVSAPRTPRRASWWQRLRARLAGASNAARRGLPAPPTAPVETPPTWRDRLRDRLLRALWESRIGQTLGRRHAAYLRRMLEMFDRGDLDAALRHAIPLGGGTGPDGGLSAAPPRPRTSVDIPLTDSAGRRSHIPVSVDGTEMIRARYRAALARLEQLGRIEEAAFVLAELLGDVAGAVSLLERHRRFELAARVAEGRNLAPGLVVRLWFLAGDRERAAAVARRHGAWADAIARMEQAGNRAEAAPLRLLWADALADAGDLVQAVDVAWPLADARPLALAWIDRGIAVGGSAAARLLVKKLAALPAAFADIAPALLAILDDGDDDAPWRRVALASALVAQPVSPELRAIARPAVRAILADMGRGADGEAPALLPRLMRLADDAALRADQPIIPAADRRVAMVDRAHPLTHHWTAADAGVVPVRDVAPLPGGRLLLALGELGVRIVARDGRTAGHIDQPADALVISDHGASALAVIRRGGVLRVARLDLVARRGAHWCDAEIDHHASSFDGSSWLVSRGGEVLAIDATAARWKALWGVELDRGTTASALVRDGEWLGFLAGDADGVEVWCYQGATLRSRRRLLVHDVPFAIAPRPASQDAIQLHVPDGRSVVLGAPTGAVDLGRAAPAGLAVDGRVVAVTLRHDAGATVVVLYLGGPTPRIVARLHLDGATAVAARFVDFTLAVGDDRGRALVLDLRTGALRRDLRIAP